MLRHRIVGPTLVLFSALMAVSAWGAAVSPPLGESNNLKGGMVLAQEAGAKSVDLQGNGVDPSARGNESSAARVDGHGKPRIQLAASLKAIVPIAPEPVASVPDKPPVLPFQGTESSKSRSSVTSKHKARIINPDQKPVRAKPEATRPETRRPVRRAAPPRGTVPPSAVRSRNSARPHPVPRSRMTPGTVPGRQMGTLPPPRPGLNRGMGTGGRPPVLRPGLQARSIPQARDFRPSSGNRPPVVAPPVGSRGPAVGRNRGRLPPALPYVPSRSRNYTPPRGAKDLRAKTMAKGGPIEFDRDGYVTARIPDRQEPSSPGRSSEEVLETPGRAGGVDEGKRSRSRGYGATGSFPDNPIDLFILDSFSNGTRSSSGQGVTTRQERRSGNRSGSSSLLGGLYQLGSGVKESISRFIPLP